MRLTLWVEMKPRENCERAMANAAITSAVPTTPLTAAWTGNQALELVTARAHLGTSAPIGKMSKAASAPQMICARNAASDGPLEENVDEFGTEDDDEPGADPDPLGEGFDDTEPSVSGVMRASCMNP